MEDNTFAGTAADDDGGAGGAYNGIQLAGQHTIVRRNIFYKSEGTGIGLQRYSPEAEYNLHNRIYNNVFYDNAGGAIMTGRSHEADHFGDNIIQNNILINNRVMPLSWADNLDSGHQFSHRDMENFLVDRNCFWADLLPTDNAIYVGYDTRMGVTAVQGAYPSQYVNNVEANPLFESATDYNFRLQENSPMIDAGQFLTTAVGAGTGSRELVVADATCFSDGFGIRNGDRIQLINQDSSVVVTAIDYSTRTLTLNGAISWRDGDSVALQFAWAAPDLGAFEYGMAVVDDGEAPTTPSNPSAAAMSTTEISLTWTASTDNVDVDMYNIYRCEGDCTPITIIGTTTQTTYTDNNLSSATAYTYQVAAVDTSGNVSGRTDTFTGTTQSDGNSTDSDVDSGGSGGGCFIWTLSQVD